MLRCLNNDTLIFTALAESLDVVCLNWFTSLFVCFVSTIPPLLLLDNPWGRPVNKNGKFRLEMKTGFMELTNNLNIILQQQRPIRGLSSRV